MILIYNLTGLLLGLIGVGLGLMTFLLTGRLSLGLLIIASVWLAFGFRRRVDHTTGAKGPFPSVFFIPLGFWGIPIVLLVLPVFLIEQFAARQERKAPDQRAALFNADEAWLRTTNISGDVRLSRAIREGLVGTLVAEAKAEDFVVFTRTSPDAVLVLIAAPNLKQF